ncbi:MAG: hypothetical protein ACE5K8_03780 [Candidatus Zixiibacteriota bacterium]
MKKFTGGNRLALTLFVAGVTAIPTCFLIAQNRMGIERRQYHLGQPLSLAQQIPRPAATEDAHHKMAPDGEPSGNQYAYIVLPLILKSENSDNRYKTQNILCREINASSIHKGNRSSVLTSTSLISSRLGRQLTLVGAKPSGTS